MASPEVALSLLSCFDFEGRGIVSREEWQRGTKMCMMPDVGADEKLWQRLLRTYGGASGDVETSRIPERGPLAADPLLMSHVIKALIRSIALLSDDVEALKALPAAVNRTATKVQGLEASAARRRETQLARATLISRRDVLRPALHAWSDQAREQRTARREAAHSARNPGLGRAWLRWRRWMASQSVRRERERIAAPRATAARRRRLAAALHHWTAQSWESHCAEMVDAEGWRRIVSRRFHTWARRTEGTLAALAAAAAAAVAHANALADADARPPSRAASPPAERQRPPPVRALATGWHRDLALYGTSLSAREETFWRSEALLASESQRANALEVQLAASEAKAALLERRKVRAWWAGHHGGVGPGAGTKGGSMAQEPLWRTPGAPSHPSPPHTPFAQSRVRGPKHALNVRNAGGGPPTHRPAPTRPVSTVSRAPPRSAGAAQGGGAPGQQPPAWSPRG
jgi:hypothetical protein